MKFYNNPASPNSRKVEFVLRHLGLEAERVLIDFADPDDRATLTAANPNNMIPALVDGDTSLWESNAICGYLCSKVDSTPLWPKSPARYDIMRWQSWQLAHFGPAMDVFTYENFVKGLFGLGEPDRALLDATRPKAERFLGVLNHQLEGRAYITGDTFTLADVSVGAMLSYAEPARIPLEAFGEVRRWRDALADVPQWPESLPPPPS